MARIAHMPHIYREKPHKDKKTGKLIDKQRYEYRRRWPRDVKPAIGKDWFVYKFPQRISEPMANELEPYVTIKFQEVCAAVRANRPVPVLDMRGYSDAIISGFHPAPYTSGPFNQSRIQMMPISTPGLVEVGGGTYLLDDDPVPVLPVLAGLTLDQALTDWKAVHAKSYGGWRDKTAEDKAEAAKRRAAASLFAYMGTCDLGVLKTAKLQEWVDSLDAGQAYYYGNDVKALMSAMHKKNRFGEDRANPAEKLFIPAKPEGDDRLPLLPADAARVLVDARQREPLVRWGQWCAAHTGFITTELVLAEASEIKQIDGVWVWDCRGRKLKSAFRPRVVPLHPSLIAEGFVDYARARGDGMLFDLTDATKASAKLMAHLRGLKIEGRQYVHYSWRHDFTSQLDRFPDKISSALGRVLTGHAAPDVHEKNYIHKHIHEMHDAVKLISYPYERCRH